MSFAAFPAPPSDDVQLDTQLYTMIELEGNRYRAFFAKLGGSTSAVISRDAALEFFRKSSLSEEQVQELYTRLKEQHLLRDFDQMNETEFVMGMHLIVCITKRNLVKIPPKFPGYLFPTLHLTPEMPPISGFPESSDSPQSIGNTPLMSFPSSTGLMGSNSQSAILMPTSAEPLEASLVDAKSLSELMSIVIRSKQREYESLSEVDQSETRALQSLQACLERIANQVDGLGFPVPSSARSLDSMDDFKNLLQKHVHSAKQEIQTMQIDAQMRSVASEVAQDGGSDSHFSVASRLTQELLMLQQHTAQLMVKKENVIKRLVAVRRGGTFAESVKQLDDSNSGDKISKNAAFALSKGVLTVGELGTEATAKDMEKPPVKQVQNNVSSEEWDSFGAAQSFDPRQSAAEDPFAFGSAVPTTVTDMAIKSMAKSSDSDFAWGGL